MPIYEYVCQSCGEPVERLQKLSDAPLTDCPACGEARLKRKVSAAGFRLSGGGWYETDFKSDGKRNLSASGDSDSATDKSSKSNENGSKDAGKGQSDGKGKSTTADGASSKSSDDSKPAAKPSGKSEKTSKSTSSSD